MRKVELGSITIVTTGPDLIILNDSTIDIDRVVLMSIESDQEAAFGFGDTVDNFTGSIKHGDKNISESLTFYRNISSVKTKVLELEVTNLDIGEFSINVKTCTTPTKVWFLAEGS